MTTEFSGSHDGYGLSIGIVVARFNENITIRLLKGVQASLAECGVRDQNISISWVPGSFELPLISKVLASSGNYNAIICLGAVIRGETDHYTHVAAQAVNGISKVALETGIPVILGVLTTDTVKQAIDRAGGESGEFIKTPIGTTKSQLDSSSGNIPLGNAGYNAGLTAVETANLARKINSGKPDDQ